MYKLESYNNGGALVVNSDDSDEIYRSTFNASSAQEAESIVVGLNQGVLIKRLAEHRYAVEIGGIDLPNGLRMLTDRDNRSTFKESYQDMKNGLIPDTDWKAVNSWKTVELAEMEVMAKALAAHVRGCYRGECAVATAINSATTILGTEAIDVDALFSVAYDAAYAEVMATGIEAE